MTRTEQGYDPETGAPIASTGGGFDPDEPPDVPLKPRRWRWAIGTAVVGVLGLVAQWCGS